MMNRKLLSLFFLVPLSSHVMAQDVIVKKDGSTILSKVLEVNETNIRYKKFSNQDGPTYTMSKSDIMVINYEGGDKDTFDDVKPAAPAEASSAQGGSQLVDKAADARNAEIVALYNHEVHSTGRWEATSEPAKCGYAVYWADPRSVFSNDEIEVAFQEEEYRVVGDGHWTYWVFRLKNKTDKIIYLDLANCFRTYSTGEVRCYYEAEETTVSKGSGSGGSVNLGSVAGALGVGGAVGTLAGGVALGGGTTGTVSKTYGSQRVISIPPHGQRNLSDYKRVHVKGSKYETVSRAEAFNSIEMKLKGKIKSGEDTWDESSSPFTIDYAITYSTSETFATYSILRPRLFLKTFIGSKYSSQHIKMATWSYGKYEKYMTGFTSDSLIGTQYEL